MESKQEKRKSIIYFWIILGISGFFGATLSILVRHFDQSIQELFLSGKLFLLQSAPYMLILLGALFIIASLLLCYQSQRLQKSWNQENEQTLDAIDRYLGLALGCTAIGIIINMLWFGFCLLGYQQELYPPKALGILHSIPCFLVITLIYVFLQRYFVELTKKLYPEKQGDALDFNFQKTWLASCDEQEKQAVYCAAYKAYSFSPILFSIIFICLLIGSLYFDMGVLPLIITGTIWLTQTIVYLQASLSYKRQQ